MGYEYITQPQIFLAPVTATNGFQGINEAYPLLTTYQSWTSTAAVDASAFPIPDTWTMLNESGSFIVSVGGVIQPPSEYTVDRDLRTLTFNALVSGGVEIAATQLATAAPSSQSFDYVTSVSANFNRADVADLSAIDATIDSLYVTNLTAVSSVLEVVNITQYELDGYQVNGDLNVTNNVIATNVHATTNLTGTDVAVTNAVVTTLSTQNVNIYNGLGTGNTVPAAEVFETLANCVSALAIDVDGQTLYLPLLSAA